MYCQLDGSVGALPFSLASAWWAQKKFSNMIALHGIHVIPTWLTENVQRNLSECIPSLSALPYLERLYYIQNLSGKERRGGDEKLRTLHF